MTTIDHRRFRLPARCFASRMGDALMRDLADALIIASVNAGVVIGCLLIWATILGAVQW